MKITVISDTHIPRRGKWIPDIVFQSIESSDLIIHAGDFTSYELLVDLQSIKPLEGVAGNNDGPEILMQLGKKKIVQYAGYHIGIIHGDGIYGTTIQRVKQAFAKDRVDIVVFGHSHQAYQEWDDGVLYFNPGSPTDKRRSPKYSFGELELGEKIEPKIHYFL
ncbi:metallophosphoesterase family protein [Tepidibacillus fermentans]|uniref:Phosphoesterase n=1 Tax=Tepidibacillus fermentans TaxID=1281767 RepID=A0A4R3KLD7_9BACI|nr:metallophosphoesterase family protein [Tepidibacillus fermentans]TCS83610.1 hypothetical protein EDD72_104165 [Tepidibacillus fermentans]